ncbi:MAG: AAA family ATPase [Acidithiobacillus sp.]
MNADVLAIFTVGTSAAGKSSWAQTQCTRYPELKIRIIERDRLRQEVFAAENAQDFSWSQWDPAKEERVQWLWETALREALDQDVLILADTHLDPRKLEEESAWLASLGVREMAIQYFAPEPLVELIRRDQSRPHSVGAAILREQIQKIQPEERYWEALEMGQQRVLRQSRDPAAAT